MTYDKRMRDVAAHYSCEIRDEAQMLDGWRDSIRGNIPSLSENDFIAALKTNAGHGEWWMVGYCLGRLYLLMLGVGLYE